MKFVAEGTTSYVTRGLWSLILLATPGCTYPFEGMGGPVISGQVTRHGKPVTGGFVMYFPETPPPNFVEAVAVLDDKGRYRLTQNGQGIPLVAGSYKITVRPEHLPPESFNVIHGSGFTRQGIRTEERNSGSKDSDSDVDATDKNPAGVASKDQIPSDYYSPHTTRLKIWLRPQPMTINIDVKD